MHLLFITRKYPPMVGGMENVSYNLAQQFKKKVNTTLITWGKSQKYLPIVLPLFLIKALYLIPAKKITHVHIGDALLSPLGLFFKTVFGVKTSITIHGLDIIFNFPGYQFLIPWCVRNLDTIICISNATRDECIKRGIPEKKCVIINWGVHPEEFTVKATRTDLANLVGQTVKNKKVIITVGRLVKRKGVAWFIDNVMPKLNKNILYLVIGEGPEKERIENLILKHKLQDSVILLGKISNEKLKVIYNTADIFIMPNIKDNTSFEGFGIVAIEASSTGLPVIASNLEGISDAVINEKIGALIRSNDSIGFKNAINATNSFSKKTRLELVRELYTWEYIGDKYIKNIL